MAERFTQFAAGEVDGAAMVSSALAQEVPRRLYM